MLPRKMPLSRIARSIPSVWMLNARANTVNICSIPDSVIVVRNTISAGFGSCFSMVMSGNFSGALAETAAEKIGDSAIFIRT